MKFNSTQLSWMSGVLLYCWLILFASASAQPPTKVLLASDQQAHIPIVISPQATEEISSLAQQLADALQRITGASFTIEQSNEPYGIVLGTVQDWPSLLPDIETGFSPAYATEDYLIRSEDNRLLLIGRTALATQHATWDFLHHLGFRQFFPGEHWEVWPSQVNLSVQLDLIKRPDFYSRNFGFPRHIKQHPDVIQWEIRNRTRSGFFLRSYHMYEALIKRNPRHFEQFPEDIIPADKDVKLDPSRPSVLEIAVQDSVRILQRHPDWTSISMEPSDGGNWRKDSPLGSPSNQAVTLANHVARSLREIMPERHMKVGLLAYYLHSPPPSIPVDRDVVVRVATAYIQGGYTVQELLSGWHAQGAETGVSEFMSIWSWYSGLPGQSRAADLEYLQQSIPEFYELGARHWNTQATGSWGPDGVGYYLASRMLWDPKESEKVDTLLEDFYTNAFAEAADDMRAFHEKCLFKSGRALFSGDLIGRMYRYLDSALHQTQDENARKRIFDYVIYTRYLELVLAGRSSEGEERQQHYEQLLRFVSKQRDTFILNMASVVRRSPIPRIKTIKPKEEWHTVKEDQSMLLGYIEEGITRHPVIEMETIGFSRNLVPTPDNKQKETSAEDIFIIHDNQLALFSETPSSVFRFSITGAQLYTTRGPVKLRLVAESNPIVHEVIQEKEIPADGSTHEVVLHSNFSGLHWLEVSDGGGATRISWPQGQRVTVSASPNNKTTFVSSYRNSLSFHVPQGTRIVGGYSAQPSGQLRSPDGKVVFDFTTMNGPGYFSVEVPDGMDNQPWSFSRALGDKFLLTVPPWLARNNSELLTPSEAVTP